MMSRSVLGVADHLTSARRRLRRRSSRTTPPPTITSSSYLNELQKLNSGASYFSPSLPPLPPLPLSPLSLSFLANALPANTKIRHAKKITRNTFIKNSSARNVGENKTRGCHYSPSDD